jgi:predicted nucleic-acid-binding protein
MVSVDTNLLVRIATKDDAKQTAAADSFIRTGAWISLLVLAETIWVLGSVYGRSRLELSKAIEILMSHEHLVLEDPEVVKGAHSLFSENSSVSFSACLIFEIARKAGHLPLGTFDRNLEKFDGVERVS